MNAIDNTLSNHRAHQRVQFFRLRTDEGFVPIFAFAPTQDTEAIAAVVLDLSEGGAQILCSTDDFVETAMYDCALVKADLGQGQQSDAWVMRRVWSREEGMYLRSGFSFSVKTPATSVLIAELDHAQHHVLRCVLHPLERVA
jgi:hypothetical protein